MHSYNNWGGERYSQHMLNRIAYRGVLVMDEIAVVAAFFSALIIRFQAIMSWAERSAGVYMAMLFTAMLFQLLVSTFYDQRRPTVADMDPFENLIALLKSRFLIIAMTTFYFTATNRNVLTSRIVFLVFMILSVVYGYGLRMGFRSYYKKTYLSLSKREILKVDPAKYDNDKLRKELNEKDYIAVIIVQGSASDEEVVRCIDVCKAKGIRTYLTLENLGYTVKSGVVSELEGYTVIPAFVRKRRFRVLETDYAISRTEEAVLTVIRSLKELSGKYICFSNVHTTVMAKDDPEYAAVLNGAAYVFPDGTPIAKKQQKAGTLGAERVAGPDFMEHMFIDTMDGKVSHYFYGASQETIDALRKNLLENYPGIDIRGMYSPPFRALTPEEDEKDVEMINASGADIVWIGLGAPKQEKWMKAHEGRINGVMMGVGAGFDFHAGTIKRAPVWIQKIGLEWLFRLFQSPKRLLKRYVETNVKFFFYSLMRK